MMKAFLLSFLVVAAQLGVGVIAQAQQQGKAARIGYLDTGTAAGSSELLDSFRKQMTQFDWIEGKNLTIEYRHSEGKGAIRAAELVDEVVGLKVDVIVVGDTSTALAAKKATRTIPIVMVTGSDPVQLGLIGSLSRPGGNITGLAGFAEELAGKRVELFKDMLPKSTQVGVISSTNTAADGLGGTELQLKGMKEAASALGLKLLVIGSANDQEKLLNAFQVAVRERVNGIIPTSGAPSFGQRKSIIVLAASHKLPAIYPQKEFVEDGGLLSYGVNRRERYRHAAIYVDKILRGAKPADLPVERPVKFEIFANLRAAKQIGLTIPPEVLARADRVIR